MITSLGANPWRTPSFEMAPWRDTHNSAPTSETVPKTCYSSIANGIQTLASRGHIRSGGTARNGKAHPRSRAATLAPPSKLRRSAPLCRTRSCHPAAAKPCLSVLDCTSHMARGSAATKGSRDLRSAEPHPWSRAATDSSTGCDGLHWLPKATDNTVRK